MKYPVRIVCGTAGSYVPSVGQVLAIHANTQFRTVGCSLLCFVNLVQWLFESRLVWAKVCVHICCNLVSKRRKECRVTSCTFVTSGRNEVKIVCIVLCSIDTVEPLEMV